MTRAMSISAVAAVLCAVTFSMARGEDPIGRYEVSGTNPGNKGTYAGTAVIEKTGDTYRVVWQIGSERYVGTGIGNQEFIAVSYRLGNDSGLALYSASGAGWKGIWTYAGGHEIGTEIWSRR